MYYYRNQGRNLVSLTLAEGFGPETAPPAGGPVFALVPGDPDATIDPNQPQPVPGTDYHYTRTPANENGWNTGTVEITFTPGTFDQFNICDGVGNLVVGLHSGNPQQRYTGETGTW